MIFGIHPVREAIEAGTEIEKIYFRKTAGESLTAADRTNAGAASALREQAEEAGIHIQEVPVEKLNRLTRNGNHQGVAAVIAAISYKDINELAEELEAQIAAGEAPLVMLIDSVTDIRNFGAIARSAECAGVAALIMPAKNSAPVNAEAIKSSAGALTLIPVSRVGSLKGAVALLRNIGMQCVAATEKSDTLVYETDFTRPTVIVMGAEDKGISRDILNLCDMRACIPLAGRIESLNVGAAAAVVLFEARRQRFEQG
ncbi:23S rRNA (guanosine(2251)-2'-O)-methyltransferase RlmB [Rikenella microfusus]|uniref:23S rRNA (guanosine(2251)-2'-O)-methyltransferase RlmB n=1 Tax=Rikenella microfusus TaxID=28139 RepID=UPI003A90B106